MREPVAGLFITVDGVTAGPDKWQFDHFDESGVLIATYRPRGSDSR